MCVLVDGYTHTGILHSIKNNTLNHVTGNIRKKKGREQFLKRRINFGGLSSHQTRSNGFAILHWDGNPFFFFCRKRWTLFFVIIIFLVKKLWADLTFFRCLFCLFLNIQSALLTVLSMERKHIFSPSKSNRNKKKKSFSSTFVIVAFVSFFDFMLFLFLHL